MLRSIDIFLIYITSLVFVSKVILERKEQNNELNLNFHQHDYNVTPERAEVLRYNKDYLNRFEIKTFKYNRSTTAFNITVNSKFDVSKMEAVIQTYKFMSNEYRLFPLRVEVNFCKVLEANVAGVGTFPCGNFTKCPMLKGRVYHVCNWRPDESKLPPYIPSGRYMIETELFYYSVEVGVLRSYAAVTRPEV